MDKMGKDIRLSLEETEQLCRLYMESRLSRLEEAELNYVLGFLPYSSPLIDEVRTLMCLSLACESKEKDNAQACIFNYRKSNRKRIIRRIAFTAASLLFIFSIGTPLFLHFRQNAEIYCQVFTNGKEVSREKALMMAEEEMERIDRFFENMNQIESEQQKRIDSFQ